MPTEFAQRPLDDSFEQMRHQHVLLEHAGGIAATVAIAIVPNFMGIGDGSVGLALEFARPGVDVLIVDVYGVDRRPCDHAAAAAASDRLRSDPARLAAMVRSAIEGYLACRTFGSEAVSLVGFCFGGSVALELARTGYPLNGVVALHSDLSTRIDAGQVRHRSRILTVQGSSDPLVPLSQRTAFQEEMEGAGVEWELIVLGGLYHAFTDPMADVPGIAKFDAKGRQLSFDRARSFLA